MMRVAICNWSRRLVGGTETYLGNVAGFLHRHGYELAFFHEVDEPVAINIKQILPVAPIDQ